MPCQRDYVPLTSRQKGLLMKSSLFEDITGLWGNQLFEKAPIGLAVTAEDSSFVQVNPAFCRFLGYSKQELLGKTVRDITHPDDWATSAEIIRRLLSPRKLTKPFEKRYRHKNGQAVWGAVAPFVIADDRRMTRYIMAQVVDITERKQAEEALWESQERTASILHGITDIYIAFDRHLRFVDLNARAEEIVGRKKEDLLGKVVWKVFPEVKNKELHRQYLTALSTQTPVHAEAVHSVLTGKWYETHVYPSKDGISVYYKDITKRKEAEEALRESEERFRAAVDNFPYVYVLYGPDLRFQFVNRAGLVKSGLSLERLVGHRDDEVFPSAVTDTYLPHLRRCLKTRKRQTFESTHTLPTGTTTIIVDYVPLLDDQGQIVRIMGITTDITKRKELESAIQRAKEQLDKKVRDRTLRLRQLTEELSRAEHQERQRIADILHEQLQQHLCGMKFRASHLKDGSSTPAMIGSADRLVKELDEAIQLTRALTTDLHPPVLSHLGIRDAIQWLAIDVKEKMGLSVTVRIDKRVPMLPGELKIFAFEAARELLLNVVKHAKVKTADLRLGLMGKGQVRIQVRDAGVGFDPNQNSGDGSHFGLFRIQERAESFGGRFEVISRPNKGTCATLILPRSEKDKVGRGHL